MAHIGLGGLCEGHRQIPEDHRDNSQRLKVFQTSFGFAAVCITRMLRRLMTHMLRKDFIQSQRETKR